MLPLREHDQKHRSGHWLCQELSSKAPRQLHSMNDFTLFTPTYFTASRRRCFVSSVYTRHALPDGSQDHPYFKIHPSLNLSIGPAVPDSVSALRSVVVIIPGGIAALFCRPEKNQTLCATNTNFLGSRISDLGWILPAAEYMHFPAPASSAAFGLLPSWHLQHQRPWLRLLHVSH
jgi:hypothetical protein